ncbi:MAG TPA: 3-phosphoshikimate 1-carboxyvinyltransferase [Vicinamibacterales bacterium]|nr:3-phosphoshikimate 1-carboxyvinyltransferase [Vicinamibacterales bacterium]
MSDSSTVVVQPARSVHGRVRPPGDKSISHRYALLAALADGVSEISGYSTGADCRSTLECLRGLGVSVNEAGHAPEGLRLRITGRGPRGLQAPAGVLDAGNSGTTIRMFSGVLAAHPFATTMTGDGSLRSRPMKRIIVPLERMGARIDATDGRPPLTVHGRADLQPIDYAPEVPSAQVKSAVLLAGLQTGGTTSVLEPLATRDHTERGLAAFGVRVDRDGLRVSVTGGQRLTARTLGVPGDISAAAFWMVAAGSVSGSRIVIEGVGLNPTRTGIIDVVRRMGASVTIEPDGGADPSATVGEPTGSLIVEYRGVGSTVITPDEVPGIIDELPVLAAMATHGGELQVTGAQELRVKESDRISALADGLRRMGGDIDEQPDGFHVRGHVRLRGGEVDAHHDHRLAMAFAVAALGASGPTTIHGAGAAAVSYPEFFTVLESLRA